MKGLILAIVVLVYSGITLQSQSLKVRTSGSFSNSSFIDFVEELEQKTNLKFYFDESAVNHLKVNAAGTDLDVDSLLFSVLVVNGLNYYSDTNNNIIVYTGSKIVEKIEGVEDKQDQANFFPDNRTSMTKAEENYFNARNDVEKPALIIIGKKNGFHGNHVLNGRITDEATGEPIVGATLFFEELGTGVASDIDGYYKIAVKAGKYNVKANSVSMKEGMFHVHVYEDGDFSFYMKKELVGLDEVKVVADRNHNVKGMQMGFEKITSKSIKEIPVVMGEKDLVKVAQMLPGVQSSGEGTGSLHVRGGTADQNLFYINQVPVYNTSHLFGFFTAFSPDIVSDFSLYKSHIPAKYGGRVSSIFDISTRQGNKKNLFAQGGISPVTGHISVEGPVVKDKISFVTSMRGNYSDWLLTQIDDADIKKSSANFYDWSFGVNSTINDKNILKAFVYNSNDDFSLSDKSDYNYENLGGMINFRHLYSPKLSSEIALVSSQYGFGYNEKTNPSDAYRHEYKLLHNELRLDFLYLSLIGHRLSFGTNTIMYNLDRGDVNPYGDESTRIPVSLGEDKGIENVLYVCDEFKLFSRLGVSLGLRMSRFDNLGPQTLNTYFDGASFTEGNISGAKEFASNESVKAYYSLEPRLALNMPFWENTSVKASYNRAAQNIFMLSNTIAVTPTNQWKLADFYLKPPVSDQYSFGIYQNIPSAGLETSVEVYQKNTKNVVEYKDGADFISSDPTEMLLLQGEQEAKGLEFMLKKKTGKFTGWLSYTYSKTSVVVDSDNPSERINFGNPYPSNFDKPHSVNLVTNLRSNRRLSFSTNIAYSTGRPITFPVAMYPVENLWFTAYSGRNANRIPDYFRVDFSINLEGNLNRKKFMHSYWMLNVVNVTGRKNAYSVYFESDEGEIKAYRLSVFGQPIVTLSWIFKLGNYTNE